MSYYSIIGFEQSFIWVEG